MRHVLASCGIALVFNVSAIAQQTSPLEGIWVGHYPAPTGAAVKADFSVRGKEGIWRSFVPQTQTRANPCLAQPHAVVINESSERQFKLLIQASKTLRGCQDAHVTVKLVDANTLQGKFGDGREFTLKRE